MNQMMGAVNLSYIRRGAAQMGTLGYWIGEHFSNQGLMSEAVGLIAILLLPLWGCIVSKRPV